MGPEPTVNAVRRATAPSGAGIFASQRACLSRLPRSPVIGRPLPTDESRKSPQILQHAFKPEVAVSPM